jgi:hypothetical protein
MESQNIWVGTKLSFWVGKIKDIDRGIIKSEKKEHKGIVFIVL